MKIVARPTRYAGTQFRSRLEARWAAFFDLAGWRWEYEPVDGEGWVPDFFLIGAAGPIPVEVKPIQWPTFDSRSLDVMSKSSAAFDSLVLNGEELAKVREARVPETLILGAYPFEYPGPYAKDTLGVLLSTEVTLHGQPYQRRDMAALYRGAKHRCDFSASDGAWFCRIGGEVGKYALEPLDPGETDALWREAGNRVQWKGAGRHG
ncbi:hypothetical protein [Methylobacterium soli]|uniref:Uncharacterized protein n=1 Tax=Methylobacterium soli TaxID=553447 RepID=A0A6L3SX17_9HYPH|nr:hypothetical protein [Methylobacterium soli]KAB1076690.1 hypothetical protein F6X53_22635 [Methylobacterium soli]